MYIIHINKLGNVLNVRYTNKSLSVFPDQGLQ